MAMNTKRFLSVLTAFHVYLMGYWFKVARVDAKWMTAEMVKFQPVRNKTDKTLEHDAMSKPFCTLEHNLAVTSFASVGSPLPTGYALVEMLGRNSDFGKDASEKFAVYRQSVNIGISHIASMKGTLVRLGMVLLAPFRAVFILRQNTRFCYVAR
jgi:hypothetical protein